MAENPPAANPPAVGSATRAPAVKRDELDGATHVTVYCRLPHGLRLQAQEPHTIPEQTPNGSRNITVYRPVGEPFIVEGNARGRGLDAERTEHKRIVMGYAVTEGCPVEVWRDWLAHNASQLYVIRRDIFAVVKEPDAKAKGAEDRTPTGLEPIDPKNLPPEFKNVERGAA